MYQLYYKYDTHWNKIGAYIGFRSICNAFSIELPPIEDVTIVLDNDIPMRDLAQLSNIIDYCADDKQYEVIPYSEVIVEEGKKEILFDQSIAYKQDFFSNAPNEQTMIIVGDSFSEVMIDLAAKSFQHVIFIRRDYGHMDDINEMVEELLVQNDDCLLVMEIVERGIWWLEQGNWVF